jgi:leucyl/phenylalanyl-tRNA--protein transferase
MFILPPGSKQLRFPPAHLASPEGLLAVGGDLRAGRLLEAYRHGIFPWYSEGQPILWWSPDPRCVLHPGKLRVSRSLRKTLRSQRFTVTFDSRFREVMQACAGARPQSPDGGTWITPEMLEAYVRLHALGHAHSVEVWKEGALAGGLYGVALGGIFFGESMFSRVADASKVALVHLVARLNELGIGLIDCQLPSPHLFSLGAEAIPRADFLRLLDEALVHPDRPGIWARDSRLPAATGTDERS